MKLDALPPPVETVTPLSVMIIDDDPMDAAQITRLLERCSPPPRRIVHYEDAEYGLNRLILEAPDVVFVDQMLGNHRGLDLLHQLRSTWSQAEYVLLTGSGDEQIAAASLRAGASDYLNKNALTLPMVERSLRYLCTRRIIRLAKEASTRQLQTIFNASADLLAVLDPLTGVILQVNEAGRRVLGHAVDRMEGQPLAPLMPDEHWRRLSVRVMEARLEPSTPLRVQIRRADDSLCAMDASVTAIPWSPPHERAALLTLRDVTCQVVASTSNSHLKALVEHSPDAIISTDLEGRITSWNPAAAELYGQKADQMRGRNILTLAHEEQHTAMRSTIEQVGLGAVITQARSVHLDRDQQTIPVSMTVAAVREGRTAVSLSWTVRDDRPHRIAEARIDALTADLHRLSETMKAMEADLGRAHQTSGAGISGPSVSGPSVSGPSVTAAKISVSDSLETELVSKGVLERQLKAAQAETQTCRNLLGTVNKALEQERRRNADLARRLERALHEQTHHQSESPPLTRPLPSAAVLIESSTPARLSRVMALTSLGVQTSAVSHPKEALNHLQHEEPGVILLAGQDLPHHLLTDWVGRLKRDQRSAEIPLVVLLPPQDEVGREHALEAGANATLDVHSPLETLASLLGTLTVQLTPI